MATDKTTLKSYFETGDIPSQAQFEALIDSFFHLSDDLSLAETKRIIIEGYSMLETPTQHINTHDIDNIFQTSNQSWEDESQGVYEKLNSLRQAVLDLNAVIINHRLTIE